MAGKRKHQKSGGARKIGRNLVKCQIYRSQKKREKSHIITITKHINHHPNDRQAKKALVRYEELLHS